METEPCLMTEPQEDCAIKVVVNYNHEPPRFLFERLPSHGKCYNAITFRQSNGRIGVYPSRKAPPGYLFTISFSLPSEDTSGGFAGIKIWPEGETEPDSFLLPDPGVKKTVAMPPTELDVFFTLEARYTSPGDSGKATVLRLGDPLSVSGTYQYCLGIYRNKERRKDQIAHHDPRIYNTGDIGDGGLWRIIKSFLKTVFGR